jgi:hypothetical protein
MTIKNDVLKKPTQRNPVAFGMAEMLASELTSFLNTPAIERNIASVHKHGATSTQIQAIVQGGTEELGFTNEKKHLFKGYPVPSLRPDFFVKIDDTGILLEVERGKTTANNMDLLDLWKCHICEQAEYLFLLVPNKRHAQKGTGTKPYKQVQKRLSTFFRPGNYVNVEAVFLFGYGEA